MTTGTYTSKELKEAVTLFLIHNQVSIKKLLLPYEAQYSNLIDEQPPEFFDEVSTQFLKIARTVICEEVAKCLYVQPDDLYEVIQALDVEAYLGYLEGEKD